MNKDVLEIVKVAQEFMEVNNKANKLGILTGFYGDFQFYEAELFIQLVSESGQLPQFKDLGEGAAYRYRYRAKIDGVNFIYISDEPIFSIDMEIVEEIKL